MREEQIRDASIGLASLAVEAASCVALGKIRKKRKKKDEEPNICPIGGGGIAKAAGSSFPKGTLIWTEDGFKPIEQIEVGDLVWSRDEDDIDGENTLNPVTELFRRTTTEMSVIRVKQTQSVVDELLTLASIDNYSSPELSVKELRLTPEHPVYVTSRNGEETGWLVAGDLLPGDLIEDIDGGDPIKIVSNYLETIDQTVYNFEVADHHTYFATEDGIWVHNPRGRFRKVLHGCLCAIGLLGSDAGDNKPQIGSDPEAVQKYDPPRPPGEKKKGRRKKSEKEKRKCKLARQARKITRRNRK